MTQAARIFKIENKLAKVVRLPGGKTVAEAITNAGTRIAGVRDICEDAMQERIARLATLAGVGRRGDTRALDEIYAVGNELLGLAGAFEMTELSEAAYSLCDLADAFRERGDPAWPAIDVHVDGLRMLSLPACGPDDRRRILEGLHKVRSRFVTSGL